MAHVNVPHCLHCVYWPLPFCWGVTFTAGRAVAVSILCVKLIYLSIYQLVHHPPALQ
jgi:hypothetical protein